MAASAPEYKADLAGWQQRYAGQQIAPVLGAGVMPPVALQGAIQGGAAPQP